jgi:hypothetical protein
MDRTSRVRLPLFVLGALLMALLALVPVPADSEPGGSSRVVDDENPTGVTDDNDEPTFRRPDAGVGSFPPTRRSDLRKPSSWLVVPLVVTAFVAGLAAGMLIGGGSSKSTSRSSSKASSPPATNGSAHPGTTSKAAAGGSAAVRKPVKTDPAATSALGAGIRRAAQKSAKSGRTTNPKPAVITPVGAPHSVAPPNPATPVAAPNSAAPQNPPAAPNPAAPPNPTAPSNPTTTTPAPTPNSAATPNAAAAPNPPDALKPAARTPDAVPTPAEAPNPAAVPNPAAARELAAAGPQPAPTSADSQNRAESLPSAAAPKPAPPIMAAPQSSSATAGTTISLSKQFVEAACTRLQTQPGTPASMEVNVDRICDEAARESTTFPARTVHELCGQLLRVSPTLDEHVRASCQTAIRGNPGATQHPETAANESPAEEAKTAPESQIDEQPQTAANAEAHS